MVAALRNGRHAVVAYRFAADGGTFTMQHRTLVVPAHSVQAIGLTGGSYDTFGQIDHRLSVYLEVAENGTVFVGTTFADLSSSNYVKAHAQVFGETLVGDPDHGDTYVTRLGADGTRLGTSVVGTELVDEMYGLRVLEGSAYVVGRNETWNDAGTGHDAFVGRVDGATGVVETWTFDVALGDIVFDVAFGAGGELFAAGASGYVQNPYGASISDASDAFLRSVTTGAAVTTIALPDSVRHDEARWLIGLGDGRFVVGGMLDGVGTHTADADLALLHASGFLLTTGIAP